MLTHFMPEHAVRGTTRHFDAARALERGHLRGQFEDQRLDAVIGSRGYLEATTAVLLEHDALWFMDEWFVVSRRRG